MGAKATQMNREQQIEDKRKRDIGTKKEKDRNEERVVE